MVPTTAPMLAASDDNIIKFIALGVVGVIVLVKWIVEQAQAQKAAAAKPSTEAGEQQSRAREIQRQMEEYRKREAAAREAATSRARPAVRPPPAPPAPVAQVQAAPTDQASPRPAPPPSARPARRRTLLGIPLNRRNLVRLVALSDVLAVPAFKRDRVR